MTVYNFFAVCLLFVFLGHNAFSQSPSFNELNKQFIKSCVSEKTQIVKKASGSDCIFMAELGIDFVLASHSVLGDDRDLSALAVASVLTIPEDGNFQDSVSMRFADKLLMLFRVSEDQNVKVAVLNRLQTVCRNNPDAIASLLNNFVSNEIVNVVDKQVIFVQIIKLLGELGNQTSYKLIFELWRDGILEQTGVVSTSLVQLSVKYPELVWDKLLNNDRETVHKYFSLLISSSKPDKNFKACCAENVLSYTVKNPAETQELQLMALQLITDNRWSHAADVVSRYATIAIEEYEAGFLRERDFISVIDCITRLAFASSSSILNDYLGTLNKRTENNQMPSVAVVLTVINSLGVLGDKNVFDNLLYVTYLNYPSIITQSAREALAKLKW